MISARRRQGLLSRIRSKGVGCIRFDAFTLLASQAIQKLQCFRFFVSISQLQSASGYRRVKEYSYIIRRAQITADTGMTLAPSTLFYLFAHRCVPPSRFIAEGTRIPCSGVKVQTDKLANLLLVSSFWGLREQGLIGLTVDAKKKSIFDGVHVQVTQLKQGSRPGLERLMVENLTPGDSGDIAEVICRAFEESDDNPWKDVVEHAIDGDVDCTRVTALEPQFETLMSSWESFRSNELTLYEGLCKACAKAVRSCKEIFYA